MDKVCVVGLGKAGLPLACVIADSEVEVVGLDIDAEKVTKLRKKINPIPEEPGISEILQRTVGKNFSFATDYNEVKDCNVYIVIVPLFIDENKKCDFSILENAFLNVGKVLKKDDLVVLETTVPPKTTETFVRSILENASGLTAEEDFYLAYSPERIMTGYSISRYKEFPKVAGGITNRATEKAVQLYKKFCKAVKPVKNARTAELVKVAEGIYRDCNIALSNELIKVCDHFDVDFWEMRAKANHDFCNILEGGNVGGHCIPVYPWFVINEMDVPLMKTARLLNDGMVDYYVNKLVQKIGKSGKIGIVGLSFREGVKEHAYTRSIPLTDALRAKNYEVFGIDPLYNDDEIRKIFKIEPIKNFEELNCIIIMNKNKEYVKDLLKVKDKVIDIKNILNS